MSGGRGAPSGLAVATPRTAITSTSGAVRMVGFCGIGDGGGRQLYAEKRERNRFRDYRIFRLKAEATRLSYQGLACPP